MRALEPGMPAANDLCNTVPVIKPEFVCSTDDLVKSLVSEDGLVMMDILHKLKKQIENQDGNNCSLRYFGNTDRIVIFANHFP